MANLDKIQKCINQIPVLLQQVENPKLLFQKDEKCSIVTSLYSAEEMKELNDRIDTWIAITTAIIKKEFGDSDPGLLAICNRLGEPILSYNYKAEITRRFQKTKDDLEMLLSVVREEDKVIPESKLRKVFISHKEEDKEYAHALVRLVNFIIGPDGDKIFCSSIPGYGIKPSRNILEELKFQFQNYEIYMIIIHSPRYYNSAICLNEMGAAWALGTKFCSFMTKDCSYDLMKGVINNESICININDDKETLNSHLNDFKNDLIDFFGAEPVNENKWETERKHFTDEV